MITFDKFSQMPKYSKNYTKTKLKILSHFCHSRVTRQPNVPVKLLSSLGVAKFSINSSRINYAAPRLVVGKKSFPPMGFLPALGWVYNEIKSFHFLWKPSFPEPLHGSWKQVFRLFILCWAEKKIAVSHLDSLRTPKLDQVFAGFWGRLVKKKPESNFNCWKLWLFKNMFATFFCCEITYFSCHFWMTKFFWFIIHLRAEKINFSTFFDTVL